MLPLLLQFYYKKTIVHYSVTTTTTAVVDTISLPGIKKITATVQAADGWDEVDSFSREVGKEWSQTNILSRLSQARGRYSRHPSALDKNW